MPLIGTSNQKEVMQDIPQRLKRQRALSLLEAYSRRAGLQEVECPLCHDDTDWQCPCCKGFVTVPSLLAKWFEDNPIPP